MKTPRTHKVVTVARGGGYAARCTVVIDGVETLCDATFAFDTRTEARESIRHEDAPGAVAPASEGEDQNPEGTIMPDITQDPSLRRGHEGVTAWARRYADSLAAMQARVRAHVDWAAAAADAEKIGLSEQRIVDEVVKKWGWKPPAYPRDLWPSWATECEVSEIVAFDAMISFRAPSHGERDTIAGVSVECIYTVVVSEQPGLAVGDYFEGQPYIWSSALGDSLDLDVAIAMRGNLEAATAEFVRIAERDARTVMP